MCNSEQGCIQVRDLQAGEVSGEGGSSVHVSCVLVGGGEYLATTPPCACVCVCACVCLRSFVRSFVHACVRVCACVCVCICVCASVRACMCACMHVCEWLYGMPQATMFPPLLLRWSAWN